MGIDRKELKRQAREDMKRANPPFWAVALVYFLMTTGVSMVLDRIPFGTDPVLGLGFAGIFVTILFSLYQWVVEFGYRLWCLWTSRHLDPGINSLTQGFTIAAQVVLMQLHIFLRVFGWLILASILISPLLLTGLAGLVVTALSALMFVITLRYALSPYLLADHPEDGAAAAVRRSATMMQGWKMELFRLEFSFLGWFLLSAAITTVVECVVLAQSGFFAGFGSMMASATGMQQAQQMLLEADSSLVTVLLSNLLTLPIFLWLTPYRGVSVAAFYDARLQAQKETAAELPPL